MYALRMSDLMGLVTSRMSTIFMVGVSLSVSAGQRGAAADLDVLAGDRRGRRATAGSHQRRHFVGPDQAADRRQARRRVARAPGRRASRSASPPGETTLTVTPAATTSAAQLRASAISAALVAAYWLRPALPCATRLPISTTRPSRRAAPSPAPRRRRGGWRHRRAGATSARRRRLQAAERADAQHAGGMHERAARPALERAAAARSQRRRRGRPRTACERRVLDARPARRRSPCTLPAVGQQALGDRAADARAAAGDDAHARLTRHGSSLR